MTEDDDGTPRKTRHAQGSHDDEDPRSPGEPAAEGPDPEPSVPSRFTRRLPEPGEWTGPHPKRRAELNTHVAQRVRTQEALKPWTARLARNPSRVDRYAARMSRELKITIATATVAIRNLQCRPNEPRLKRRFDKP